MNVLEQKTHSFIVKIWLEEAVEESGQALWRGQVMHVPGGERYPITELKQLIPVIEPYLDAMGVPPTRWRRARQWLTHWTYTLKRRS